jgi:hypothetical protein
MPLPKSTAAFADCEERFAQALDSVRGKAFTLPDPGSARRFSQRMNTLRSIIRKNSKEVYDPGHPSYGTSIYDHLKVSIDPENPCRILVQPYSSNVVKEEDL